eukprot:6135786-Pyramimonas_sp.AAC.1
MRGPPCSIPKPSDGALRANAKAATKRPRGASPGTRASMSTKSRWPIAGFSAGSSRRRSRRSLPRCRKHCSQGAVACRPCGPVPCTCQTWACGPASCGPRENARPTARVQKGRAAAR